MLESAQMSVSASVSHCREYVEVRPIWTPYEVRAKSVLAHAKYSNNLIKDVGAVAILVQARIIQATFWVDH